MRYCSQELGYGLPLRHEFLLSEISGAAVKHYAYWHRRVITPAMRGFIVLAIAGLWNSPALTETSATEDSQLFRNYESVCGRVQRNTAEMGTMLCRMLEKEPQFVREMIRSQLVDVCGNIAKLCAANLPAAARNRYAEFSAQLSCSRLVGSTNCFTGGTAPLERNARGDIEIVIRLIDALERAGGRAPNALKRSIALYAEALDINRDVETAINRVNAELTKFYADVETGCREREEPEFVAACTARIDREYLARNTRAVLGWANATPAGGESVAREVMRKAVERWAERGRDAAQDAIRRR